MTACGEAQRPGHPAAVARAATTTTTAATTAAAGLELCKLTLEHVGGGQLHAARAVVALLAVLVLVLLVAPAGPSCVGGRLRLVVGGVGAAQDLLIKGYDLAAIMRAGGWSDPSTVSRYLRFSQHNIWK